MKTNIWLQASNIVGKDKQKTFAFCYKKMTKSEKIQSQGRIFDKPRRFGVIEPKRNEMKLLDLERINSLTFRKSNSYIFSGNLGDMITKNRK